MGERETKREICGPITLSILDRLIDEEPKSRVEVSLTYSASLARLKLSLRRDLENLLNTRCTPEDLLPESCAEIRKSVYHYGVPDITDIKANFLYNEEHLRSMIAAAVATFEPRLTGVRVSVLPPAATARILRFVIEGMLQIDPAPEHIVFDAALELISGEYQLSGDPNAR